jgi:aminopeptidase
MEKLWETILYTVRVTEDNDPAAEWEQHTVELVERMKKLDNYSFKYLKYKNSLGTDLTVELPENHFWDGAREITDAGVQFIPNVPTEEIFTAPKRDGVNGIVYASKPLVIQGQMVNNFHFEFENGRIVKIYAEEGQEALEAAVNTDEGSHYLGEAALVAYNSPISKSGILFYNTLFDENAACHLAFGSSYPNVKGASSMTEEERLAIGLNSSMTHCDFMIGTPDLSIIGVMHDGTEVPVFVDGNFAI